MLSSKIKSIIDYDLVISTSWHNPDNKEAPEHGICEHTYEMIEYYWLLHRFIKCCLLWPESMTPELLSNILSDKYNFDQKEILSIIRNSKFLYRPKLLRCKKLLLVDGQINRDVGVTLIYEHLFLLSCGNRDNHLIDNPNITVLQDQRVYSESGPRTRHYVKKISIHRLRYPNRCDDASFLYLSTNCRFLSIEEIEKCITYYNNIFNNSNRKWIIGTDNIKIYQELNKKFNVDIVSLPIENFHEKFNHYVYTPTSRKFDCSNRLIVECKHFKKMVNMYNIDNQYLEQDKGLNARLEDLQEYEKLLSLVRQEQDEIINIIRNAI